MSTKLTRFVMVVITALAVAMGWRPACAAPVPTHLMKPAPVRVGDQFRWQYQPYYVSRVEGNRVWVWLGDNTGGIESEYSPFTVAEVEAIRDGRDLPTDRLWRLMESREKLP